MLTYRREKTVGTAAVWGKLFPRGSIGIHGLEIFAKQNGGVNLDSWLVDVDTIQYVGKAV
jgi:hypothetical protein